MRFVVGMMCLVGLACLATVSPAMAQAHDRFAIQTDLDHVWVMTATALVFFMQCGFMLLEAGSVRSKNSVNVAQKNLVDFLVSAVCYGLVGYALMFGASHSGLFGWDMSLAFFGASEDWSLTFFVFQMVFCGTAATIVSGAVAERMSLMGYIAITAMIALVIYPISGHWAWGGLLNGSEEPFLAAMGFMDFAGGTVVHAVGGAVALAAVILVGPRKGRFDVAGNPIKIRGHSPILATFGGLMIWIGWIGFNGGSTTVGSGSFAEIVYVTMVGGAVGGLTGMVLGRQADGFFAPSASINGMLAGLVGVTAGADVLTGQTAVMMAVMAAIIAFLAERWLLTTWKLDDPVGAISVHGVAGVFGTVMIAFIAPEDALLAGSRMQQLVVQLIGCAAIVAWAFGIAFIGLRIMEFANGGPRRGIRVSEEHEDEGLNAAEHDAPLGTGILQAALYDLARGENRGFQPIHIPSGDESHEMSVLVNEIMEQLHDSMDEVDAAVSLASAGDFASRMDLTEKTGVTLRLCNGVNRINAISEQGLTHIADRLMKLADGDLRPGDALKLRGQFGAVCDTLDQSVAGLRSMVMAVEASSHSVADATRSMGDINAAIAKEAREQGGAVDRAKHGIAKLHEGSDENLRLAMEAAHQTADARDAAEQGHLSAQAATEQMRKVADVSNAISNAVNQIESIAKQINILAINASVEAERAQGQSDGQQTGGFKIVAKEVRQLAERTGHVVADIRDQTQQVTDAVHGTSDLVTQVTKQIERLFESTSASAQLADQVAAVGRSQKADMEDVADAIASVHQGSLSTIRLIGESETATASAHHEAARTDDLMRAFKTSGGEVPKAAA